MISRRRTRDATPGRASSIRSAWCAAWRQPAFVAHSNLRDPFNLVYRQSARFSHVGFRCARTLR